MEINVISLSWDHIQTWQQDLNMVRLLKEITRYSIYLLTHSRNVEFLKITHNTSRVNRNPVIKICGAFMQRLLDKSAGGNMND